MAWDTYQPTSQDEIAAKANEAAERIAQELLGVFVSRSLGNVGKLATYANVVKLVEAAARGAAVRGYVQGYNQAVDDVRAGKTLQRLRTSEEVSDQR